MNCKPLESNARRSVGALHGRILLFIFLFLAGAAASRATSQQVVFDITGFTVENGLAQSGTSTSVLPPAQAYSYQITGTVHGTGLLQFVIPSGTSLADALDQIQSGFSSNLQGTVANPGGTIPFTVLDNKTAAGSFDLGFESITASATFSVYVDAEGHAIFSINPVSFLVNGNADDSDTIVFDSGTVTTTAVLSPVATTGTASLITGATATLNASVNPNGDAATVTFEYGFDQTYGSATTPQVIPESITPAAVSGTIGGLLPGTKYHFRVDAVNTTGTSVGSDMTFTTAGAVAGVVPTVTTGTATVDDATDATLNGQVNPNGESTNAWFEYGTDTTYSSGSTSPQWAASGHTLEGYLANIGSLTPGVTYHYRAIALNSSGPAFGADETFSTPGIPAAPTVTTGTATNLTPSAATLNGSVDPNNADTSVYFQYGFTNAYGSNTNSTNIGAGPSAVAVSATLGSLVSGSTYHFCVVAQNSQGGPISGNDMTFTVPAAVAPTVTTGGATSAASTAKVFATVNPNGTDTTVAFNYGSSTTYSGATPSIDIGSGTAPVLCTGTLTGLEPGMTYHYEPVATNTASLSGTGADASFSTPFDFANYDVKFAAAFSAASFQTSGLAGITVSANGKYTASVKVAASTISLSGSFAPDGSASATHSGLTLGMQLGNAGGISVISGTMSGLSQSSFVAYPVLTAATATSYTIRLPHSSDLTLPQGDGYGTLTISNKGAVQLAGKLGDGTSFTAGATLLANHTIPLYILLYTSKGCLAGTLTLEPTVNGDLDGPVLWSKPATSGAYTPGAFTTTTELYGSLYTKPLSGHTVISVTAGNVVLNAGNLTLPVPPIAIPALLSTANKVTFPVPTDSLTIKISTSDGLFSGSFKDPATHAKRDFNGALFQGTLNFGVGVFKGSSEAGSIELFP